MGSILQKIHASIPSYMEWKEHDNERDLPSFGLIATIILIPLLLILMNTVSGVVLPEKNMFRSFFTFLGHPFVALTIATLLAFYFLGRKRGFQSNKYKILRQKRLNRLELLFLSQELVECSSKF